MGGNSQRWLVYFMENHGLRKIWLMIWEIYGEIYGNHYYSHYMGGSIVMGVPPKWLVYFMEKSYQNG